ncbi:hypothetical protein HB364_28690 [Pseudoflavitalea sp. X16]|uniref:hypothetical protein n=1 Tax=Paraflavitalea devenefica TaxID=2716334 RepID=UPI001422EFAF|nr:hypothetical protein [Paraflavitalea devenefica]NII29091.1 hypothetical protein [Paraflavitalea devenefica]
MKVVLPVQSARFNVLFRHLLKAAFIIAISLVATSPASAQQCEGCNVLILGEELVRVGDTKTYYVTPRYPDAEPYTPIWDYNGYLSPFATIVDQGQDAWGNEYIVLYFYAPGYTWLTYDGLYDGMTQDFSEITLHILP